MNLLLDANEFLVPLFWISIKTALLVSVAGVILVCMRSITVHTRYSTWFAVVTASMLLPLFSILLPELPIALLPAEAVETNVNIGSSPVDTLTDNYAVPGSITSTGIMLLVYLLGFTAVCISFTYALYRLARVSRCMRDVEDSTLLTMKDQLAVNAGIKRPVRLMISNTINTPMTWGVINPRVALPEQALNWSVQHQRNALLHEICHIRQYDWLRLWVMKAAAAMYWFNPFVWLAVRQFSYESERACDDYVLHSGGRCSDYAEQLIGIMAGRRCANFSGIGIALGKKDFLKRVRAILDPDRQEGSMNNYKTRLISVGVLSAAALVAACQPEVSRVVTDREIQRVAENGEIVRLREVTDRDDFTRTHTQLRTEIAELKAELTRLAREYEAGTASGEETARLEDRLHQTRQQLDIKVDELRDMERAWEQGTTRAQVQKNDAYSLDDSLQEKERALREHERSLQEQERMMDDHRLELQQAAREYEQQLQQQAQEFRQHMQQQQQEYQLAMQEQAEQLKQRAQKLEQRAQDLEEYQRRLEYREQELQQRELQLQEQTIEE